MATDPEIDAVAGWPLESILAGAYVELRRIRQELVARGEEAEVDREEKEGAVRRVTETPSTGGRRRGAQRKPA